MSDILNVNQTCPRYSFDCTPDTSLFESTEKPVYRFTRLKGALSKRERLLQGTIDRTLWRAIIYAERTRHTEEEHDSFLSKVRNEKVHPNLVRSCQAQDILYSHPLESDIIQ